MSHCRTAALRPALLLLSIALASNARAQKATVEGVARAEESGMPMPFALVRLVHDDSTVWHSDNPSQEMTNANGRYRFVGVAPGRYRVQLLRIGFQPALSGPVQVAADETVKFDFRVPSQPVVLPTVTVTAGTCVTAKEFAKHPQLRVLWQQAREGASVRTQLKAQYRYHYREREVSHEVKADGPGPDGTLEFNRVSDPKSALANAARRRGQLNSRGYYVSSDIGEGIAIPHELEILHEDFLKTHCFYSAVERGDGEVGLGFRPLRERRNFLDIRGTIWLDSATFLARRIDLEYVDGKEVRANTHVDFGDIAVAGGTLRMPIGGAFSMRPSRKDPTKRVEGKNTVTYWDFEEVQRR